MNDRRKRAGFSTAKEDRLPPHSPEAEAGVLGCILLSPESCIAECLVKLRKRPEVFYDLRHQTIYQTMLAMADDLQAIDMITIQQMLKKKNLLNEVGGLQYLSSLPDAVPSAANLGYYIDIVLEKWESRRIIQTCTEAVGRIYDYTGSLDKLKDEVQRDLEVVFGKPNESMDVQRSWEQLLEFDTENDANCIIGFKDNKTTRYLCKSHFCWLIGPSGIGKSSFLIALSAHFASGRPFCGINSGKPRKVLVIQAENDEGDLAEMVQGIESGNAMDVFSDPDCAELLNKNIVTLSVVGCIGREFCQWLRRKIIEHKAEIVIVDPMLSFAGIDFGKQSEASLFFRVWLLPVLLETGAVLICGHHTGKPVQQQKNAPPRTVYEMMYDGLGSSELVNFSRAVMLIQPAGDNAYRLVLAKRGKRAWAHHPDGSPAITLWLRHGSGGINWEQIDPPEEPSPEDKPKRDSKLIGGKPSKINEICAMNTHDFCAACKSDGESKGEISRRLESWLATNNISVSEATCKRVIDELVSRGKISKGKDLLFRIGANA
jgi:hypothetical protein